VNSPIQTNSRARLLSLAISCVVALQVVPMQAQEAEPLDLQAIALIRKEAMERSQIMEIAWSV
jgi:hypothetical protein